MIRKNWLFIGILSVVLVFSMALVFTTCSDSAGDEEKKEEEQQQTQTFTYISYDSEGNRYTLEITGDTFTFTVEQYNDEEQTYSQLFTSSGSVFSSEEVDETESVIVIIVNEEELEITIGTEDGTITAIDGSIVDEEGEEIIETPAVLDPPGEDGKWVDPYPVEKPLITAQSGTKRYLVTDTVKPLSVTVASPDDPQTQTTYQWYESEEFVTTGGDEIPSQIAATYQPAGGVAGSTYYYVVATNTKIYTPDGADPIVRIARTTSAPMGVVVLTALPTVQATVTVTDQQNQYVRGFGGMSNAFGIGAPAKYMQMADIDTMFNPANPNYLGFKILRIIIFPQPLDDVVRGMVEPQMGNSSTYIQAVQAVNRHGGYVLASPWTPPVNYKTNNSLLAGGSLKTDMYASYASYLKKFANDMKAKGAPIYAISIQNEPSLKVSYHGMEWTAAEHRDFLNARGANISRLPSAITGWGAGAQTPYVKVMSGEAHQIGPWYTGAMNALLANSDTARNALAAVDIVGYHIYGGNGTRDEVTMNNRLVTAGKEIWMTERNLNSQNDALYWQDSTWDYVWVGMGDLVYHVIGVNSSNAFVYWYIKRFYAAIGDGSYSTVNGAVLPRGHLLSHYALYATDTVRVNATTTHPAGLAATGESGALGTKGIQLTAYQRKSAGNRTTARDNEVMADEDSYSVVIADNRTTGDTGTTLRVNIPTGFAAEKVTGIISDSSGKRRAPLDVELNPDGDSADFTLPMNAIVSLKFEK